MSLSERLETETPAGRMIFTVLAAVSQLERELIVERVKNGLLNARAKGKILGRKKLRNSTLIRELLAAGMSFRKISLIAKCSHGSVSAEKSAMKREALALIAQQEVKQKSDENSSLNLTDIPPVPTETIINFVDLKRPPSQSPVPTSSQKKVAA